MNWLLRKSVAIALSVVAFQASADITIGVSLPMTGPASSLGIPISKQVKLWPTSIGGEKLNVILLDNGSDPTNGITNARKFLESNADLVIGCVVTPVAAAMAGVLNEAQTPHYSLAPIVLAQGKDDWTFRISQNNAIMAEILMKHMQGANFKTLGFLGYNDSYGETWLMEVNQLLARPGMPKLVATERFARNDTSVTAQALKIIAAKPDAVLIVASGGGAEMPQRALVERQYKGQIYQTHAAANQAYLSLGGKTTEGALLVAGPAIVPEQLPSQHPAKAPATDFVAKYEAANGVGSRNTFPSQAYDVMVLLNKVIPIALKSAKPGTPSFRAALRDATEMSGPTAVSNGLVNYTKSDHWGHNVSHSGVMLKVVNGDWNLVQ